MPARTAKRPDLYKRFDRLLGETARKPSANHVHQLRTTARRLESAVGSGPVQGKRSIQKLQKQLSKVRKRAGHVRDLDVQLAALEKLNIGREESAKAELASDLNSMRKKQAGKLLKLLDSKGRTRIRKRLHRAEQKLKKPSAGAREYQAHAKAALGKLLAEAGDGRAFTQESLHEFRLASKRTRYLFELAPDSAANTRIIEKLKTVQDAVGEWHDWLTLTKNAAEHLSGHSALLAALENTTRAKFAEALSAAKGSMRELRQEQTRSSPRKRPAAPAPADSTQSHAAIA